MQFWYKFLQNFCQLKFVLSTEKCPNKPDMYNYFNLATKGIQFLNEPYCIMTVFFSEPHRPPHVGGVVVLQDLHALAQRPLLPD